MPLEIKPSMATYKIYIDSEIYHEKRFIIDRLLNQEIEESGVELDYIKESYLVGDVRILITTEFESPLKEGSKNFY